MIGSETSETTAEHTIGEPIMNSTSIAPRFLAFHAKQPGTSREISETVRAAAEFR